MIISSKKPFLSLVRVAFSIALIFILSGCIEDKDYFTHFGAAAAGAATAGAIGYAVTRKPKPTKVTRTTTKSRKIIPARTIEVIEEEEFRE